MSQRIFTLPSVAWILASSLVASAGFATASGTIWSPATPDIQGYGVFRLGIDNYFTVGRDLEDGGGDFPTDLGLTVGVLPFEKLQMEIGIDLLEPSDHPWSANFKVGLPRVCCSTARRLSTPVCSGSGPRPIRPITTWPTSRPRRPSPASAD